MIEKLETEVGEIFEATGTMRSGTASSMFAVKIYKNVYSLRDLQTLWPPELVKVAFQHDRRKVNNLNYYLCLPLGAMVLDDDRFAFIFPRYGGDLRKLIDIRMRKGNDGDGRPFSPCYAFSILHKSAKGMEMLHTLGFLHRDLKAANVLYPLGELKHCEARSFIRDLHITDFEPSVATAGTGFWRAPEILRELKNHTSPLPFTRQADVYSFGMTCYEVLTGYNPLEAQALWNYNFVINGGRPMLPDDIYPEIGNLVSRCWREEPLERSPFEEIVRDLKSIRHKCNHPHYGHCEQKKQNNGRTGFNLRLDSRKVVVKNEQQMNTRKESSRESAALPSPQSIVVQKEQKKQSIRREKSMSRRRSEKTSVHSFNFRALTCSCSLDEETLPSLLRERIQICRCKESESSPPLLESSQLIPH